MAQTFKVGDKVRLLRDIDCYAYKAGDVTTIEKVRGMNLAYGIQDRDVTHRRAMGWVGDDEIEPVKPEPKFKVGDRVRIRYAGRPGVVTEVAPGVYDEDYFRVQFDGGWLGIQKFNEIEHVPSQEFKLKPGDKVKNLKTGRLGGKVVSTRQDGNFVVDAKFFVDKLAEWEVVLLGVPAKALEAWEAEHPGTYDLVVDKAPW